MQKVILPTNFTKTISIAPVIASLVFKSDLEKTPDINKLKIRFVNIFYHIQQQNIFSTFTPQFGSIKYYVAIIIALKLPNILLLDM